MHDTFYTNAREFLTECTSFSTSLLDSVLGPHTSVPRESFMREHDSGTALSGYTMQRNNIC